MTRENQCQQHRVSYPAEELTKAAVAASRNGSIENDDWLVWVCSFLITSCLEMLCKLSSGVWGNRPLKVIIWANCYSGAMQYMSKVFWLCVGWINYSSLTYHRSVYLMSFACKIQIMVTHSPWAVQAYRSKHVRKSDNDSTKRKSLLPLFNLGQVKWRDIATIRIHSK